MLKSKRLNNSVNGFAIDLAKFFNILLLIRPGPEALLILRDSNISITSLL